jgi:hypothetical protein
MPPPPNLVRQAYVLRFGIKRVNIERDMPNSFLRQLGACASDCERRLLLGLSEKYTSDETPRILSALMVRYSKTHAQPRIPPQQT